MKKPSFKVAAFGRTKYGEKAKKFILNGAGGVVMEVSDYGGKVIRLFTPDRDGKMKDVVVGFDSPAGWDNGDAYWGCIIGRYGNRIAKGEFKLNGKKVKLPALNNAPAGIGCNLHGGARGGNAYVYREVYQPDLIIAAAAETIKAAENGDRADDYIAPPDMWNRKSDTGRSTAEIFAQHGIILRKACNDRAQGWLDLKEWLHPALNEFGERKPKLRIFSTCTELIRTLPSLVHDEGKYNDISDRIHEYTHAPDAIRYWAAGRPCRNLPTPEPDPDYPDYGDEVDAFLAYR